MSSLLNVAMICLIRLVDRLADRAAYKCEASMPSPPYHFFPLLLVVFFFFLLLLLLARSTELPTGLHLSRSAARAKMGSPSRILLLLRLSLVLLAWTLEVGAFSGMTNSCLFKCGQKSGGCYCDSECLYYMVRFEYSVAWLV